MQASSTAGGEGLPPSAVSLRGIGKSYPGRSGETYPVLARLDLEVARGELVAVTGDSGAGKTTLLNLLGLLDRPSSGAYALDGERVDHLPEERLAGLRAEKVGVVFQHYHLFPHLTVAENLEARYLYGSGSVPSDLRRRVWATLESLGIGHLEAGDPRRLSGGERQRVALARALIRSPSVLLADEPTGNLDPSNTEGVVVQLRRAAEAGAAVIVATHDREVAGYCPRRYHLLEGRLERVA